MPELINLRPRNPQSPLVLPYLPMSQPTANPSSPASTGPLPIHQHPRYAALLTLIHQRLVSPNPHLQEIFLSLLDEFDNLP